jgi:hypothetical protein
MSLREAAPIPVAFDFTRFLASSITFMTYLAEVSLFFDDKCLARLQKTVGVPKELGIPKGLRNTSTSGIMSIRSIKSTRKNLRLCVFFAALNNIRLSGSYTSKCDAMGLHVRYGEEAALSPNYEAQAGRILLVFVHIHRWCFYTTTFIYTSPGCNRRSHDQQ